MANDDGASIDLTDSFEDQLFSLYSTTVFNTEDSDNPKSIAKFSYAGGQHSTYSFGLFQLDVGNNKPVANFLLMNGFSPKEVMELSQHGGLSKKTKAALSKQLATLLATPAGMTGVSQLYQTQFQAILGSTEKFLQGAISANPYIAGLIYSSPTAIQNILDFCNQFGKALIRNELASFLTGATVVIKGGSTVSWNFDLSADANIQAFILATPYGTSHPKVEADRETRFDSAVASESAASATPARTSVEVASDTTGAGTTISNLTNVDVAVDSGLKFQVGGTSNGDTFALQDGSSVAITAASPSQAENTFTYNGNSADLTGSATVTASASTLGISGDNLTGTVHLASAASTLLLGSPSSFAATIFGFVSDVTLDLAGIGTAATATIGAGNILSVQAGAGGTVNLHLDPAQSYTGETASVKSDGHGGTDVTLMPTASHTITFSEYPIGTINPSYTFSDNTVDFVGEIVVDDAQPNSPAIAANTSYNGPVYTDFANPVTHVSFDAGYFNNLMSTTITFYGQSGQVLQTSQNTEYGIVPYSYTNSSGISAVDVVNTGYDESGFSVDTVTFSGSMDTTPTYDTADVMVTNVTGVPGDPIFTFTVTRTGDLARTASVAYAVVDAGNNPIGPTDLPNGTFPVGKVSFEPGQASQTITVDILGGFDSQYPRTFAVSLFAPTAGTAVGAESIADATTLPPPTISGTIADQETSDNTAIIPFSKIVVADPNADQQETVSVTPSNISQGRLSDLGYGSLDLVTGVYTVAGSAAAVTAALRNLVFDPSATATLGPAGQTTFSVYDVDTGGAVVTDNQTSIEIANASVPCYCRGTRILTSQGEVAVEELRVGDLVVTRLGEGAALKPIRWLGHRRITLNKRLHSEEVLPIRIFAGALAEGQPRRDLLVSPGHRMHLDGKLIRATDLVNGATIVQECPPTLEYWHVELDAHDILVAEGAEAESYQDVGNRAGFENGAVVAFRPVLDRKCQRPCLPYSEPSTAIRERLIHRAETMGWIRTCDPQLWLEVDAVRVDPVQRGNRYRFTLPAGCKEAHLRSLSSTPAYLDPLSSDTRRLGVPLIRVTLSGPDGTWDVALDNPLLREGFSHEEHEAGWSWRWTDGNARMPLGSLAAGRDITCIEIASDRSDLLFWEAPSHAAIRLESAA